MKTNSERFAWQYVVLAALILAAVGGLYVLNQQFVFPRVRLEHFILNWNSLQRFIYDGPSPYSPGVYEDTARKVIARGTMAGDLEKLHLPLNTLLFYLPFAWMEDLSMAGTIWLMATQLALGGVFIMTLTRLEGNMPRWFYLPMLVFFLSWQPLYTTISTGADLILQMALILLGLRMLEQQNDEYAGLLFAFAFFNLEVFGMFFLTLAIWVTLKSRWGVFGGFGLTLGLMLVLAFVFETDWVLRYLKNQLEFWRYNDMQSVTDIFTGWLPAAGVTIAKIVAVLALALVLFEWQTLGRREAGNLYWLTGLTLAIVPLLGFSYRPEWAVVAMPGLMIVFNRFTARWHVPGFVLTLLIMLVLGWGLWAAAWVPSPSVHMVFFPILTVLLMYWVRWDVLKKKRLWADELADRY